MAKPQRSDELTAPPVIGQRYLVPTVAYPWFGKVDAWPVMGPKHTDAEHIGFEPEHYHVDIRFLSEAQVRRIEKAAYGQYMGTIAGSNPLASRDAPAHPAPTLKRLTCRRDSHHYPSWSVARQNWYPRLVAAYAGRRCGKNAEGLLVCPHKGFVLNSLQRDEQGRVVCPLHGLVIDMTAETVIDSTGGARGCRLPPVPALHPAPLREPGRALLPRQPSARLQEGSRMRAGAPERHPQGKARGRRSQAPAGAPRARAQHGRASHRRP